MIRTHKSAIVNRRLVYITSALDTGLGFSPWLGSLSFLRILWLPGRFACLTCSEVALHMPCLFASKGTFLHPLHDL
jgi:hypothetical protein